MFKFVENFIIPNFFLSRVIRSLFLYPLFSFLFLILLNFVLILQINTLQFTNLVNYFQVLLKFVKNFIISSFFLSQVIQSYFLLFSYSYLFLLLLFLFLLLLINILQFKPQLVILFILQFTHLVYYFQVLLKFLNYFIISNIQSLFIILLFIFLFLLLLFIFLILLIDILQFSNMVY